jgi:tetratricopeptide (TPR) repeat protein
MVAAAHPDYPAAFRGDCTAGWHGNSAVYLSAFLGTVFYDNHKSRAIFVNKDKQEDIEVTPSGSITVRRLWLFRIIAITVIPALLLLLVEVGLRIAGYGYPASAIITCQVKGEDAYCENAKFTWQFFPKEIARDIFPFTFAADKPDNTYRIFVLGASAAQGAPAGEYCFGRMIEVMLRHKYPKVNFEVHTLAMTAINSHVVLKIAEECAGHQSDLFVVYLGNNEVVGPYGAGTIFAPISSNLSFIRAQIAFRATMFGQLLNDLLESAGTRKDSRVAWGGMKMFLEKQVRADSDELQIAYRHYRKNLEDIAQVSQKMNIPIIFSSVGCNLKDSPPFASLHRADITENQKNNWDKLYQEAITLEAAGKYTEAVNLYHATEKIDETYADLQFRLGQCYQAISQYEKAKERYIKARELDTLRFRPDRQINEIIRDVADNRQDDGIYFVDTAGLLEANSPNGTPGEELFYEHVHFNFTGNYLVAKTIFEQIEKILPDKTRLHKTESAGLLTEQQCRQYLAYTDWDRCRVGYLLLNKLLKKPPYTNQLDHNERIRVIEHELKNLKASLDRQSLASAKKLYLEAILQAPADWWLHWGYADLLTRGLKNRRAGAEQRRIVTELVPNSHTAHYAYATSLANMGNLDAAITATQTALRLYPIYANAHHWLAMIYLRKGNTDKAIEHFSNAIRLRPDRVKGYTKLGPLLEQEGKVGKAEQLYRKGLTLSANKVTLHYQLALLLANQKRFDEAIEEIQICLKSKPNSAELLEFLDAVKKAKIKGVRNLD